MIKKIRRKILISKRYYNVIFKELPTGEIMEIPKAYIILQIFKDDAFLSTITNYNCMYCNRKGKTTKHVKKVVQEETIITVYCDYCNKLLVRETFNKQDLKD